MRIVDPVLMPLYVTEPALISNAEKLVAFTNTFQIVTEEPKACILYLRIDTDGLAVISNIFKPLYVQEIYSKLINRFQNLKNELLVQAMASPRGLSVWDLTAGLGKDAFILASSGYIVTMVEQNPVLVTIVHYALTNNILPVRNLSLVYANSLDYLAATTERPNIIYLDPMFKDDKAAKARKEMQLIQLLTEGSPQHNDEALFIAAYAKALNKIIVKRDNKQETLLASPQPSHAKSGKTIRFDIYPV